MTIYGNITFQKTYNLCSRSVRWHRYHDAIQSIRQPHRLKFGIDTSDRKPGRILKKMKKTKPKIRKTITLSPKTAKKIEVKAKEENRTVSNFIEHIVSKHFRELEEME